jgi:uncharacterized protein (TIGR03000 family)
MMMRMFVAACGLAVLSVVAPGVISTVRAADDAAVVITMVLPEDAEVWFDGTKTTQTGTVRKFYSPAISTSKTFRYQIRVSSASSKLDVSKPVSVSGGDRLTIDYRDGQVRETRNPATGTGAAYFDPDLMRSIPVMPYVPSYFPNRSMSPLSEGGSRDIPYGWGQGVGGG